MTLKEENKMLRKQLKAYKRMVKDYEKLMILIEMRKK